MSSRLERRQQQRKSMGAMWNKISSSRLGWRIFGIGIIVFLIGILLFNILIWTTDVSELEKPAPQPTIIYDQTGKIASKISNSKIEGVTFKQIPKNVINAVISTEDQHFYQHNGINYFGILRAFFQNMTSGEIVAGGSTITQQLAKNTFLTQERTFSRKWKELIISKKIERTYFKDEIMERYLNQIYFGEGAWGIQSAAKTYFGKDVSELTLSESAMLAGIIKAPSALSPIKHLNKAIERRNIVLALMEKEGYIDQKDVENAKKETIALADEKVEDEYKGKYPYYVDHIMEEAIQKYHLTENEVLSGGLQIYTELNPTVQHAIEEVYKIDNLFPQSQPDQLIQSGGVFINPKSGGIQALVGGRGQHTYRGFNHATQLVRQPGSTMKPLAVYTPALEKGYNAYDLLSDQPLNINGYQPNNYDGQFHGQVTMYDAIIHSYNVPAVWLLNQIGLETGIQKVVQFGIPVEQEDQSLGIALGGMSKGTSPLMMAQAYSAFANEGVMVEAHAIQKIVDANGEILGEWKNKSTKVTEPEVAQKMTYLLKGVIDQGTGQYAQVNGVEIAGKTGTTQLPFQSGGAKDHWFVGYTPDIVGAIWLGYDQTDQNHYLPSSSTRTVPVIFHEILSNSVSELSNKTFNLSNIEKKYKQDLQKIKEQEEKNKKEEKEWLDKWEKKNKKAEEKSQKNREKEEKKKEKGHKED